MKRWLLPFLLCPWLLSRLALAEPPQDAESSGETSRPFNPEAARRLGLAGLSAFEKNDHAQALELFEQAERQAHSPVFLLYIARCYRALSRVEEARALLYELSRQPTEEDAPKAWARARQSAQTELDEMSAPETEEPPTARVPKPPNARRRATVSAVAQTDEPRPTDSSPSEAAGLTGRQKGALAAYSTGAVGLVIMISTGTMAFILASQVKDSCIDGICPPGDLPRAEEARRLANLATAGASSALVGAATGTLLLLLPAKTLQKQAKASGRTAPPRAGRAALKPHGLGLGFEVTF